MPGALSRAPGGGGNGRSRRRQPPGTGASTPDRLASSDPPPPGAAGRCGEGLAGSRDPAADAAGCVRPPLRGSREPLVTSNRVQVLERKRRTNPTLPRWQIMVSSFCGESRTNPTLPRWQPIARLSPRWTAQRTQPPPRPSESRERTQLRSRGGPKPRERTQGRDHEGPKAARTNPRPSPVSRSFLVICSSSVARSGGPSRFFRPMSLRSRNSVAWSLGQKPAGGVCRRSLTEG